MHDICIRQILLMFDKVRNELSVRLRFDWSVRVEDLVYAYWSEALIKKNIEISLI